MAVRKIQPVTGGFVSIVALTVMSTAPVLAAPDRSICDDTAAPTLEVTTTDFSNAVDADESIELLGPNFELASRDSTVDDEEAEQTESTAEDDTDSESGNSAVPGDAGPLVHKRQMYRRDI